MGIVRFLFLFFRGGLLNFFNICFSSYFYRNNFNFLFYNYWYSFFFSYSILIFLFVYIRTLSANEKFFPQSFFNNLFLFFFFSLIFFSYQIKENKLSKNINFALHLYEIKNVSRLIFLIIYLLITMICVVKLVKFEEGPLIKRL